MPGRALATFAGSVATIARLSRTPRVIAVFSHWRVSLPVTSAVLTATVRPCELCTVSQYAQSVLASRSAG